MKCKNDSFVWPNYFWSMFMEISLHLIWGLIVHCHQQGCRGCKQQISCCWPGMSVSAFEHMKVLGLSAFNIQLRTFPLNQPLPQHAGRHSRCYKVRRQHHCICLSGQHCDWCHLVLHEVLLLRERQFGQTKPYLQVSWPFILASSEICPADSL